MEGKGKYLKIEYTLCAIKKIYTMGFDFSIQMCLHLCDKTGRPYFYNQNFVEEFDLSKVVIPQECRRFVNMRGHHLHVYIQNISKKISTFPLDSFLESLPSQDEVLNYIEKNGVNTIWTKNDDTQFREALQTLVELGPSFIVSWSY